MSAPDVQIINGHPYIGYPGQITREDAAKLRMDLGRVLIQLEAKHKPGQPCNHPGCLSHISHPCEGCGRIGGR